MGIKQMKKLLLTFRDKGVKKELKLDGVVISTKRPWITKYQSGDEEQTWLVSKEQLLEIIKKSSVND